MTTYNRHRTESKIEVKIDVNQGHEVPKVGVTWENVNFFIEKKEKKTKREIQILHNVWGQVNPGEMLGIMGPSGCGKTTLLDILAGRKTVGRIEGDIKINGEPRNNLFKRIAGYVTQDDVLMETQTVFETLMFYAELKLPSSLSTEYKKKRVREVLEELKLSNVADVRVGSQFQRGISGGEKKRVAIGRELITNPSLLFFDEPTTGLDSYNSLSLMTMCKNMVKETQRAIICSIHQPRSTIFELFDKLLLMKDGRIVFFGPTSQATQYFSQIGYTIPAYHNPADFLLDVILQETDPEKPKFEEKEPSNPKASVELPEVHTETLESKFEPGKKTPTGAEFGKMYENSEIFKQAKQDFEHAKQTQKDYPQLSALKENLGQYATNVLKQTAVLTKRATTNILRTPNTTFVQLFQTLFITLLMGTLFLRMGLGQSSIQDRMGLIFFLLTNQCFSQTNALAIFINQRGLLWRERSDGAYSTFPYFFAQVVTEMPLEIFFATLSTVIIYWMVGLHNTAEQFFIFLLFIILVSMTTGSMFAAIGALAPNALVANILAPVSLVLFMLFGGFFMNVNNIPDWYIWIHYLSFIKYAYEGLIHNELHGLEFTCSADEKALSGRCPIPNGDFQLQILGMDDVVIWRNVVIMIAMVVFYRIVGYLAIRFLYKKEKR